MLKRLIEHPGLSIPALSALSYYYSYRFESGYGKYFSIDQTHISIELENIIITFMTIVSVLWALFVIADSILVINFKPSKNFWIVISALRMDIMLIIILAIAYYFLGIGSIFYIVLVMLLGNLFLSSLIIFRKGDSNKSVIERLSDYDDAEDKRRLRSLYHRFGENSFSILASTLFLLILMPLLVEGGGYLKARSQKHFSVQHSQSNWFLVRRYGEKYIFVQMQLGKKCLTGITKIVMHSQIQMKEFRQVRISKTLRPNDAKCSRSSFKTPSI